MKTYLILGYGIPKKMESDDNYRRYLGVVFNAIFDQTQNSTVSSVIMFCGGMTDMVRPYKRSEAAEMMGFFKTFADRDACRKTTKSWNYLLEKKSLSTLENLVYAKQILDAKKIDASTLTIFCEETRCKRVKRLAKKIFGKANVVSVDFDVSVNRYLDPAFIEKREKAVTEFEGWALTSPENLKEFRKMFVKKMAFLRKAGPGNQVKALEEWWHKELDDLHVISTTTVSS